MLGALAVKEGKLNWRRLFRNIRLSVYVSVKQSNRISQIESCELWEWLGLYLEMDAFYRSFRQSDYGC
jgi:hypothetical protein